MQVLLHDDITGAGECRVLLGGDRHRRLGRRAGGVLGAVDEAEQVALVPVFEAVHLVDDRDHTGQPLQDLGSQFEAQEELPGADVQQHVAVR